MKIIPPSIWGSSALNWSAVHLILILNLKKKVWTARENPHRTSESDQSSGAHEKEENERIVTI